MAGCARGLRRSCARLAPQKIAVGLAFELGLGVFAALEGAAMACGCLSLASDRFAAAHADRLHVLPRSDRYIALYIAVAVACADDRVLAGFQLDFAL